jgi:hypothetical protein
MYIIRSNKKISAHVFLFSPSGVLFALGLQDQEQESVSELFEAIRHSAKDMARVDARPLWKATCAKIIDAARRAEQLLHPLLRVEVCPEEMAPDAAESVAFTHPTVPSHPVPARRASG